MPEVREISIVDLHLIQATNPTSLIVVYLQMDGGVAQSSYEYVFQLHWKPKD